MPYKVLIIDDNTIFTAILALGIIKEFDFQFVEAHSGNDALKKFTSDHFDLILLDLKLPDKCGFELLKQVRAVSTIPVIVISGIDDIETQIQIYSLGADHFISKNNFSVMLTLLKIRNLVRRYSPLT